MTASKPKRTESGLAKRARQQWSHSVQIAVAIFQGMALNQLTLRSMSLSFASLLSMVPMLAFSFSVLKGFGVHNSLEPVLAEFLAPLGEGGSEIADNIVAFVENINVGVLGFAGLLVLIFTVLSLVKKIEDAFNHIWYVRKPRSLLERLRDYLSIVLIGPLFVVSVIGLFGALQQAHWVQLMHQLPVVGPLLVFLLKQIPLILVIAAFTFFYAFIPNTRVEWGPALGGAVVSGVVWLIAGWAFTSFAASSAKYTAIYSGFAVMILFLIWLNLNWLVILIGSAIAFYLQYPAYLRISREQELHPSSVVVERAVLQILVIIARDFRQGVVRWSNGKLARELNVPHTVVARLTREMDSAGVLIKVAGRDGYYVPGKAVDCLSVNEVLGVARAAGDNFSRQRTDPALLELFDQLDQCCFQALEGHSLADLADQPLSDEETAARSA